MTAPADRHEWARTVRYRHITRSARAALAYARSVLPWISVEDVALVAIGDYTDADLDRLFRKQP